MGNKHNRIIKQGFQLCFSNFKYNGKNIYICDEQ